MKFLGGGIAGEGIEEKVGEGIVCFKGYSESASECKYEEVEWVREDSKSRSDFSSVRSSAFSLFLKGK